MKKLVLTALVFSAGLVAKAQTYVPVTVSGFTADVVANGAGAATASTTHDVDGVSYNLLAQNFVNPTGQSPTSALPNSGTINSAVGTTPGLTFQLAPYTSNNSLRISGTGSGTLNFVTPRSADQIYVLGFSGSGTSTVTITVNFSDATTQVFTQTVADWFDASGFAIQGISRVLRTTDAIENSTINPRLYQYLLTLNAANTGKTIQSINFNKTSAGTGVLNIMGVTVRSVPAATPNDVGVTAITSPNSGCVLSNQGTITVTVANLGSAPQSNIPVSYTLNNGTPVNEVLAGPLAPNTSINYNFTTKANLSTAGTYTIAARTALTGDALATNDEHSKSVTLTAATAIPTISANGPTDFCSGGSLLLTAATSTTGASFQWFKDGSVITNATGSTYNATITGSYTVNATFNGCTSAASAPIVLTSSSVPASPTITPNGPTTVCNGNSVSLTASSSVSGVTYAWFRNGVAIAGATSPNYSAVTGGEYAAKAVNGGCSSTLSFAILVKVNGPAAPVITQNGNVLTSSLSTGNQWYKNGTAISGATGQNYTVTSDGTYTITAIGSGCTSPHSAAVNISTTGITKAASFAIELYPNPSDGTFRLTLPERSGYQITITDLSGKVVYKQQVQEQEVQVHLTGLAKGIYILEATSQQGMATRKLIVD